MSNSGVLFFFLIACQVFGLGFAMKNKNYEDSDEEEPEVDFESDEDLEDYYSEEWDSSEETLKSSQRFVFLFRLSANPNDVRFFLYRDLKDQDNGEELFLNNTESIRNSSFKAKERTIFVIHGFWSDRYSDMPRIIKEGFMNASLPYNLIVVDWGKLSTPDPKREIYRPAAYPIIVYRNIPVVYQRVGEFIQFMVDNKFVKLDTLRVIGHSLGAHVSGGAGSVVANYTRNNGKKISRISGLDPAGPLFQGIQVQRRINHEDAVFVDIYHTNAGQLGDCIYDDGHADFLPNGGRHQPGCNDNGPDFSGSCSHGFAYHLFAASITQNFTACRCDPSFNDHVLTSSCPGDCAVSVLAGEPCPPDTRGQFYFETGPIPSMEER